MSAIADFKKRREAEKNRQASKEQFVNTVAETGVKLFNTLTDLSAQAKEQTALHLLAALLGCDVEEALEKAREAVENNIRIMNITIGFDTAEGQDETAYATVTTDDQGNINSIIEHAAELEDSAATVSDAADAAIDAADKVSDSADQISTAVSDLENVAASVDRAANTVDDSASNLAYTADDIGQVTTDLKEATAELKKPSAAPASSHGAKAAAQKNSSKK
ncbi:hypothetical protein V8687_18240 [Shewanella baltica]|uniref:hypothetical protein n=1 Tax=Shewanella baltica TaxID=62322 RepID=UPI0030D26116